MVELLQELLLELTMMTEHPEIWQIKYLDHRRVILVCSHESVIEELCWFWRREDN